MAERRIMLEAEPDPAVFRWDPRHVLPVNVDGARVRSLQAGDGPK
jgi:hypothetical protein